MDAAELIVAVAGPAGLILFLLAVGWAAVQRGSVHAYMRQQWPADSAAGGGDWMSVFDEVLSRPPGAAGRGHYPKEHSGCHSHR
jgi:hypothetical protein